MAIIKKTIAVAVIFSFLAAVLTEEEQCEQQFRSQQQLTVCRDYLRDSTQIGTEWRQQFQQCCQLLDQMDEQCRCQGIRKVLEEQRRQQQQKEIRGEELREMMKTAESLPGLCRVGPQRCNVTAQLSRSVSF